nr:uncharacterized protein LOC100179543 [Ciona intestinalis]|eukprot:XP_002129013.3 uncharacterized protein LOC100179543 [Ciona intestinalis]
MKTRTLFVLLFCFLLLVDLSDSWRRRRRRRRRRAYVARRRYTVRRRTLYSHLKGYVKKRCGFGDQINPANEEPAIEQDEVQENEEYEHAASNDDVLTTFDAPLFTNKE